MTGVTVSLLNSPLYSPLVSNGNISNTFLNEEISWTPENKTNATMPRLTTQENLNNYRASSLWYRDGSFLKLRNLQVGYNVPKAWAEKIRMERLRLYLSAQNLLTIKSKDFTPE